MCGVFEKNNCIRNGNRKLLPFSNKNAYLCAASDTPRKVVLYKSVANLLLKNNNPQSNRVASNWIISNYKG